MLVFGQKVSERKWQKRKHLNWNFHHPEFFGNLGAEKKRIKRELCNSMTLESVPEWSHYKFYLCIYFVLRPSLVTYHRNM